METTNFVRNTLQNMCTLIVKSFKKIVRAVFEKNIIFQKYSGKNAFVVGFGWKKYLGPILRYKMDFTYNLGKFVTSVRTFSTLKNIYENSIFSAFDAHLSQNTFKKQQFWVFFNIEVFMLIFRGELCTQLLDRLIYSISDTLSPICSTKKRFLVAVEAFLRKFRFSASDFCPISERKKLGGKSGLCRKNMFMVR